MYQSQIIRIYTLISRRDDYGSATAKREANYVTYVMTGQCIIIKSSISCQECVLLHDRSAIGHYANSIMPVLLSVTPEEKRSDWWRAPGSSQQCLNSRAIVCHWKIREKKRDRKRRQKRGGKRRETVESGRHNPTVSENGEKMVRGFFGWEQSQTFFGAHDVFFEENGVKLGDRVDLIVGDLILRPLLEVPKRAIVGFAANTGCYPQSLPSFI